MNVVAGSDGITRIVLTESDFTMLVSGEEISGDSTKIILQDIGYHKIYSSVNSSTPPPPPPENVILDVSFGPALLCASVVIITLSVWLIQRVWIDIIG